MPEIHQEQQQDEDGTLRGDDITGLSRKMKDLVRATESVVGAQQGFTRTQEEFTRAQGEFTRQMKELQEDLVDSIRGLTNAFDKRTRMWQALGTRAIVGMVALLFGGAFFWAHYNGKMVDGIFLTLMVPILSFFFGEGVAVAIRGALKAPTENGSTPGSPPPNP